MENIINILDLHNSQILKASLEAEKIKTKFKKIINNKEKALELLQELNEENELSLAYQYGISDALKTDPDIYKYVKSRLFFSTQTKLVDYTRQFVHEYGKACGITQDPNKIQEALNEMNNLPKYHAYWLFYSLYHKTKIPFETYKKIYTSFDEKDIQGYLLKHYCDNEAAKKSEVLELINSSTPECIQHNYFFVSAKFHDQEIFDVFLEKGVEEKTLITNFERNIKSEQKNQKKKVKKGNATPTKKDDSN